MWKAALTLPLIGKAAVVQTECLDHSPLLWTLWNYCFCLLSWVMLQWAVTPDFNVSPCPPQTEKPPAAAEKLAAADMWVWDSSIGYFDKILCGLILYLTCSWTVSPWSFGSRSNYSSTAVFLIINEYIYPNTVLKHSFELLHPNLFYLHLFDNSYSADQWFRYKTYTL